MRWILPGQLDAAIAGWFGRFPAGLDSREDTYLIHPVLRGLAVKIRAGQMLEVKQYRGSPGILDAAAAPAAASSPGGSGRFRSGRSARTMPGHPAGWSCTRDGG